MIAKAPLANCDKCPAAKGRMLPPRPAPSGVTRLAIVGEAPCGSDFDNGGIFRSAGGRLIAQSIARNGIDAADVHLTNAVLCDCRIKQRKEAAKCCAPRLQAELAAAAPAAIATLDAIATKATISWPKSTPIAKWRGAVMPATIAGHATNVLPLLHPAEVRKAPKWEPIWQLDFERVARVMRDGFIAPECASHRKYIVTRELDVLRDALLTLGDDVTLDVETVGLGPTETRLTCYGMSDGVTTLLIPWSFKADGRDLYWVDEGVRAAKLTSDALLTRRMTTHNGPSFDHIVMARYGIRFAAWEDTLLMAHALAGHLPKNLAHVATAAGLDVLPWKQLEDRGEDIERLWFYCGRDNLYTIMAARELMQRLARAT